MVKTEISAAGSMKGWQFLVWLRRNKDNLKLLAASLGGIATTYLGQLPAPWNVVIGGIAVVLGKLVLDGIEFFLTDVELQK